MYCIFVSHFICLQKTNYMPHSLTVIQPNVITSARYDYSVTEKRVIYHIIKNIQEKMVAGLDQTLFGDMILHIPMKELVTHDNYRRVRANLVSLRKKSFTITTWIDPTGKGEDGWLDVGFINYSKFEEGTGMVKFQVSGELVPYLLEIAKGFTSYTLDVALSLKSEYSQRLYECCSRFKGTGVWNISLEDLRKILVLEDKHILYGGFKRTVLDGPQKEIKALFDKGGCDLYFVYEEKKIGKLVTDLSFKIFSQSKAVAEALKNDDMQVVTNMFRDLFPKEHQQPFVKMAYAQLFERGGMAKFAQRVSELNNEVASGKREHSKLPGLIRHILTVDHQIG